MPSRFLSTLLCTLLLMSMEASASHACSCMIPWTPTEMRDASDLVIAGRVQSIVPHSNGQDVLVTIQTHAVWKGPVLDHYVMITPAWDSMCGYPFEPGEEYLVYADDNGDGNWFTHLCGRNRPMAYADEDLAELGSPLVIPTADRSFGTVKARFGRR